LLVEVRRRYLRLHTGRSRNEQVSLDSPHLRRRISLLQRAVAASSTPWPQAASATDALMPSFTHSARLS
jgi:argininosuccinate lyase